MTKNTDIIWGRAAAFHSHKELEARVEASERSHKEEPLSPLRGVAWPFAALIRSAIPGWHAPSNG